MLLVLLGRWRSFACVQPGQCTLRHATRVGRGVGRLEELAFAVADNVPLHRARSVGNIDEADDGAVIPSKNEGGREGGGQVPVVGRLPFRLYSCLRVGASQGSIAKAGAEPVGRVAGILFGANAVESSDGKCPDRSR